MHSIDWAIRTVARVTVPFSFVVACCLLLVACALHLADGNVLVQLLVRTEWNQACNACSESLVTYDCKRRRTTRPTASWLRARLRLTPPLHHHHHHQPRLAHRCLPCRWHRSSMQQHSSRSRYERD